MRIFKPFVVGILLTGTFAIAGLTVPVNARAVDVLQLDRQLSTSAISDTSHAPFTLANPWAEHRVQGYLKTAREQFRPAGPLARQSVVAWEQGDFLAAAGQGRTTTRSMAHKRLTRVCCAACCLY